MAVSKVEIGGNPVGIIDLEDIFHEVRTEGPKDADHLKDLIMDKVKVKNYIPHHLEPAYREDLYEEYRVHTGELSARQRTCSTIEIRLYGSSCFRCEQLDAMVKEILSRAGIPADYQYITDMREIARAGIITTPALAVSGTVILMGQVPAENQLEKILLRAIDKGKD
jgi:small redox-active disulfide protein 2